MATNSPAILSKSGGGGGINWGSILRDYGPAALEALSSYSAGRANNRATDAQIDALDEAGRLQYQTALQAMEMARLRDVQTRLDTEQSRYGGYNAMRTIAQQLGLPVYDQPFNRTLDAFRAGGGGGGFGGGGGQGAGQGGGFGAPGGPPMGIGDNQFRPRNASKGQGAASGAATGASIGTSILPGWGTAIGAVIGGAAGYFGASDGGDLKDGSRVYATKNGTFFDSRGNVIARVPPPAAGEGLKLVPGLQRNGAAIYVDDKGNIVRPNKQGGGYGTLTNLGNLADRPIELNGVIGRGYQPLPANDDELKAMGYSPGGNVGILPGESQGTGLIQENAPPALPAGRYGGFQETPGYQFVLDEGLRARDKMASSRGRYFSGGTGRELERYAQGVASQEYDNYFRRLMDQVTGGNSATQITTQAGDNATRSAIGSLTGGADELGSAIVGAGSARGSGILAGQQITNSGVAGIAGSGIFDRLGSIFGGSGTKQGGGTATPSAGGRKSPLGGYNSQGYTLDMMRAYGA
jgi:hypothetical protein